MEKSGHRQAGFNIVEGLLIVAIFGVLAGASWVVFQHNRTKVTDAASNPNQTTTQQTTTTTPPAPTVTYLGIKEWGVRLPLPDSIKDAYYVVSTSFSNDPDGLPSGVWLGLRSLTDPSCNPANNNRGGSTGAIGDILRVPQDATDPVSGKLYSQVYPNGVTIGGYYYGYQSWMNDTACVNKAAVQAADSAFAGAAKSTALAGATAN